jgi:16S rRNA (cytidine1402-2'-O)-methyltransferase
LDTGKLFLLPNLLDEEADWKNFLPASLPNVIESLHGLIGESEKEARRYLARIVPRVVWEKIELRELNEHTKLQDIEPLLKPNQNWGLVSDAGLPCIADPGSPLVALAQKQKVEVIAIAGPCSFILALQLSGLEGQRFSFHGYLPREIPDLKAKIHEIEKVSKKEKSTQIFIEAPYRAPKLFQVLLESLKPTTFLCVASHLTGKREMVKTQTVADWKRFQLDLEKGPSIFLLLDS